MPVIATQAAQGCESQTLCESLQTLNPEITIIDGRESTRKLAAVEVSQGQVLTLKWIIRDKLGKPVDLSTCGIITIKLRMKEALAQPSTTPLVDVSGTIVDAANGIVEASLTNVHTADPGIFVGEWAIVNSSNQLMFSNFFYFAINQGYFGTGTKSGPPRLSEIRLHLRSSSPADSVLLDDLEWDIAEITYAISRPVMYWNEAAPIIDNTMYDTQTFPYRFNWLEAIVGELMLMAAHSYRRDHLAHSSAGVSIDDKNKWQFYEQEGYRRRQIYERWVAQRKTSINMDAGFEVFLTDYSF